MSFICTLSVLLKRPTVGLPHIIEHCILSSRRCTHTHTTMISLSWHWWNIYYITYWTPQRKYIYNTKMYVSSLRQEGGGLNHFAVIYPYNPHHLSSPRQERGGLNHFGRYISIQPTSHELSKAGGRWTKPLWTLYIDIQVPKTVTTRIKLFTITIFTSEQQSFAWKVDCFIVVILRRTSFLIYIYKGGIQSSVFFHRNVHARWHSRIHINT